METVFFNRVIVKDFWRADIDKLKCFLYNNTRLWHIHTASDNTIECELKEPVELYDVRKFSLDNKVHLTLAHASDNDSLKFITEVKDGAII